MNDFKVVIYQHAADLPSMPDGSYFHSPELMELCERTPRHKPYMAVVCDADGTVVARLLAIQRIRRTWLPPFIYAHVVMFGEGEYWGDDAQQLFGLMLQALTEQFQHRSLYIELSNPSQKMFGYRQLRAHQFFPVRWMKIHNSLHSRSPEERISERQKKRIDNAQRRGATTKEVETDDEFRAFSRLLRRHNWLKPRRYIPDDSFFQGMMEKGRCSIFITQYHGRTIGCSVCLYSGNDAYLWYSASRRKSYAPLHPNAVTMWHTIKQAHADHKEHIRFLDVGLPFRKNPYRDFILSFGGKETSSYRWFRISIRWVNTLASWLWRE